MKRALVVAHPDDETLFFGGLLLAVPGDWTVLCASTPRADPIRAEKFHVACAKLGVGLACIAPIVEPPASEPLDNIDGRIGDLNEFDEIVTHNAVGEYGHRHHVEINRFVAMRWPAKIVTGGYGRASEQHRIELSPGLIERKRAALRCYDHVSPTDGIPKWRALLDRYGLMFDFGVETYSKCLTGGPVDGSIAE